MIENFPRSIRVGTNDYDIVPTRGLSSSESFYGVITYGDTRIRIEESISESKARDVLAHELTHALLYEAGYEDHTEEEVCRIGKVLAMLLRDNDFGFMRKEDET